MRRLLASVSLAVGLACVWAGCTSSSPSMQNPTPPPVSNASVNLSIQDNPPSGVTILQFQIQVTAASLTPSGTGQSPVSMLSSPQEVELVGHQTEPAFLANASVPAGQYNGLTAMFASPEMTIFNETGQTLTVGGQNCANNQLCTLTPALNQATVNIQAPTSPFPLTLSATSPVALLLHFDVNASVEGDLSVTPTVSLFQLNIPPTAVPQHTHYFGTVTAVSSPTFTLQTAFGNNTVTITTDSNTRYHFGQACTMDNFSCIMDGQVLKVRANVMSDGTIEATDVAQLAPRGKPSVEGTIIAVNAAQNQFQLVINDCQCDSPECAHVNLGAGLIVQLTSSATFSIDMDDITLPSGLSFASIADLMVGQSVSFQPQLPVSVSASGGNVQLTVNASAVQLEPSQLTATVSAVNAMASPPNFDLNKLSPLFVMAGINTIQVDTVSGTDFENISGIGALTSGQVVSVQGLLFNTPTQPTVVAEQVMQRGNETAWPQ